jgi:hypothetical protein
MEPIAWKTIPGETVPLISSIKIQPFRCSCWPLKLSTYTNLWSPSGNRAICRCPSGYTGDPFVRCDADPCSQNPCGANADCQSQGNRAVCRCREGYEVSSIHQCIGSGSPEVSLLEGEDVEGLRDQHSERDVVNCHVSIFSRVRYLSGRGGGRGILLTSWEICFLAPCYIRILNMGRKEAEEPNQRIMKDLKKGKAKCRRQRTRPKISSEESLSGALSEGSEPCRPMWVVIRLILGTFYEDDTLYF